MEFKIQHYLFALLALANNLSAIPMFIKISEGLEKKEVARLTNAATLTAFLTMTVTMLTGSLILDFFGISLDAFRIAGGILLAGIGYNMLNAAPSDAGIPEAHQFSKVISLAVIPIGLPLTAGPGVITSVIVFSQGLYGSLRLFLSLSAAILIITVIDYLAFRYSKYLLKLLGTTGLNVFTRVFGLIVMAIGTQFVLVGVGNIFPELTIHRF